MLIEKYFLYWPISEPSLRIAMENLQNAPPAIAGVCRQLSNAYLNYSNVNVLLAGRNVIVARLATLVRLLQPTILASINIIMSYVVVLPQGEPIKVPGIGPSPAVELAV